MEDGVPEVLAPECTVGHLSENDLAPSIVSISPECWQCFFPTRAGRVEFFDTFGNTMFLFEPRPAEMRVCMNSCIGGILGEPEYCYLPVNSKSYMVKIVLAQDGFAVVCDGVRQKLFSHRLPSSSFGGVVKFTPGIFLVLIL